MLLSAPGKGPLCSKEISMSKKFVAAGVMAASLLTATAAGAAPTEITMWHAMANTLGDWVADVTKDFNAKMADNSPIRSIHVPRFRLRIAAAKSSTD